MTDNTLYRQGKLLRIKGKPIPKRTYPSNQATCDLRCGWLVADLWLKRGAEPKDILEDPRF